LDLLLTLPNAALPFARLALGAAPHGRRRRRLLEPGGSGKLDGRTARHEQLRMRLLVQLLLHALQLGQDLLLLDDLLFFAAAFGSSARKKEKYKWIFPVAR